MIGLRMMLGVVSWSALWWVLLAAFRAYLRWEGGDPDA